MITKQILSMYSKTILLVDDTPLFLRMAEDCLRREQVNIVTATNGPDAVAAIKKNNPDLVFMDLYMPGCDGDEACREIKSDFRFAATPIVMVTSSDNPIDAERCIKAGCSEVIHKPLSRDQLLDICNKYIKLPGWSGKRTTIKTPITFSPGPDKKMTGTLFDISVGGLFIETKDLLPVDTRLQLEFQLKQGSRFFKCQGRVAWIKMPGSQKKGDTPTGMGVEFIEINKLDIMAIQAWIRDQPAA